MWTMLFKTPRSCFVWASLAWALSSAIAQPVNTSARDYIVAVVDSVPITNHDVNVRAPQLRDQLKQQGRLVLQGQALLKAALERLIVEKALIQYAKETGISIDDEAVDQAEQRMAAQNQITVAALHNKIKAEGSSVAQLRQNLRDQLTLQRITERNVPPRIKISDVEIDQAVRERQNASLGTNPDIELGQVGVEVGAGPGAEHRSGSSDSDG